jgi:hypothetical protein
MIRYSVATGLLWLAPLVAAVAVVVSDRGSSLLFLVTIALIGTGLGALKMRVDGLRHRQ